MRNISAWAIRNPVIPIVLFTFLLAMGLLAFKRMDINLNPDITSPAANVSISQPARLLRSLRCRSLGAWRRRSAASTA